MNLYGLIGKSLGHSFSKNYFEKKFADESIINSAYELFELNAIEEFPELIANHPNLKGLNITLPYKESIIPYLDELHETAKGVGAVNTVKFHYGKTIGFNTDTWGFAKSLFPEISQFKSSALILGNGGASKAVQFVFKKLNITYKIVSRTSSDNILTYNQITKDIIDNVGIIVQTTPLGMYPNVNDCVDFPFELLSLKHFCLDLVYNPIETTFLRRAKNEGTTTKNGLQMLYEQAEESWKIWNNHSAY